MEKIDDKYSLVKAYNYQVLNNIKRELLDKYSVKVMPNPYIDELMVEQLNDIIKGHTKTDMTESEFNLLILYYVALYISNLKLLFEIIKMDFPLDNLNMKIIIGLLDKEFSSLFDEEYYLELIKKYFKNMLYIVGKKNENGFFEKCSEMIKIRPDILKLSREAGFKNVILSFDINVLVNITDDQLIKLCNECKSYQTNDIEEEKINRLSNLLLNYDYQMKTGYSNVFKAFAFYTDDELLEIDANYEYIENVCLKYNTIMSNIEFVKKILYSKAELIEESNEEEKTNSLFKRKTK